MANVGAGRAREGHTHPWWPPAQEAKGSGQCAKAEATSAGSDKRLEAPPLQKALPIRFDSPLALRCRTPGTSQQNVQSNKEIKQTAISCVAGAERLHGTLPRGDPRPGGGVGAPACRAHQFPVSSTRCVGQKGEVSDPRLPPTPPRPVPRGGPALPCSLPLRERGRKMEGPAACLPGAAQVKTASLPVAAPHAHLPRARDCVFLSFLGGGGVRLRALSDELSDNEFAPHGALGLRGKCFGEMQLGFHQPPPPRQYKNSPGQAGSDPQAWPSFTAPCPGERLRVASFPESGFRNLALLFWSPVCGLAWFVLSGGFAPSQIPCHLALQREGGGEAGRPTLSVGDQAHTGPETVTAWGLITGRPVTWEMWVDWGPWTQG